VKYFLIILLMMCACCGQDDEPRTEDWRLSVVVGKCETRSNWYITVKSIENDWDEYAAFRNIYGTEKGDTLLLDWNKWRVE